VTVVLITAGVLVLVVTGVDVVWTVLAAGSGAGPLTARLSTLAWRIALVFGRRPDGPRHALLGVFGLAVVVGMLLSWVGVAAGAWWLISASGEGAVRVAASGAPADLLERGFFVGYNLVTLGSTTYTAGNGLWQLLPVAIGASGLVFLTLGISYLVPVASAVSERRQLAQYVMSLGRSPEQMLTAAWRDGDFGALEQHLVALLPMVHLANERHLTYPALAYLHGTREQASSSVSVVVLDDALTLLRHGVEPAVSPDRATVGALRQALEDLLGTVATAFVHQDFDPLPPPELTALREAGIPTVGDADFASAMAAERDRRRRLAALLAHDGWTIEAWVQRDAG
jgi:hypothetical protein